MQPQNFGQGSRTLGPTGTRIVGLLFILVGIPIVYITYGMIFGPSIATNWTVLKGTIVSTNVSVTHTSFNNYSYTPNVRYSYVINGIMYMGSNIYPSNNNFEYPTGPQAEAVIQNYTVGKSVNVYYDPTGNGATALTTKNNGAASTLILVFFIIGIIAILMGVLALVFGNR